MKLSSLVLAPIVFLSLSAVAGPDVGEEELKNTAAFLKQSVIGKKFEMAKEGDVRVDAVKKTKFQRNFERVRSTAISRCSLRV